MGPNLHTPGVAARFALVLMLAFTAATVPGAAAGAAEAAAGARGAGSPTDIGQVTAQAWEHADDIRERIRPPAFPDRQVSILDHGADPTGQESSTEAIAAAIDEMNAAGGGRVLVPAGEYLTGAIHFRSNVELHLADDATLRFSRDKADYLPVVKTRYEGVELMNYSPFVYGYQVENVALTGHGTLDGQADENHWWDWKDASPRPETPDREALFEMAEDGVPVAERVFGAGHFIRPNFVQFYESSNILIKDVTLHHSPMWLVHPVLSRNVTVDGLHLESLGPNNDGVNPESSRDVLITDTFFDTGDDCIAIKSGRNADGRRIGVPSENILIEGNHMRAGHGAVVAGSEMSGGVRHVYAQDNVMDSPDLDRVVRIKTNSVRGGVVEDVYVRDNDVPQQGGQAVWVDFRYEEGDAGAFTPTVRDVYIEDLHSVGGSHAVYLRGYARSPVTNINIVNSSFTDVDTAMLAENVQGLRLVNVEINGEAADTVVCQGAVWLGVPEALVSSGVEDRVVDGRRCLSEQFGEDEEWGSRGEFRAHVARRAAQLVDDGVIAEHEKDALQEAAARTDIGA